MGGTWGYVINSSSPLGRAWLWQGRVSYGLWGPGKKGSHRCADESLPCRHPLAAHKGSEQRHWCQVPCLKHPNPQKRRNVSPQSQTTGIHPHSHPALQGVKRYPKRENSRQLDHLHGSVLYKTKPTWKSHPERETLKKSQMEAATWRILSPSFRGVSRLIGNRMVGLGWTCRASWSHHLLWHAWT